MAGASPNGVRISDLKSRMLDLAQTSVYQIRIVPPPGVVGYLQTQGINYFQDSPNLELLCRAVTLPGSNLETISVNNNYAGVTERMVNRRDFGGTVNCKFYVDRNYLIMDVFEGWHNFITNQLDQNEYKSTAANYRMNFPDSYRGQLYITKFEKDIYGSALQYTMVGAYPLNILSQTLSYDQSGVLELSIDWTYIRYVREKIRYRPEDPSIFDNGVIDFARLNRGIGSDGNTRPGTVRSVS